MFERFVKFFEKTSRNRAYNELLRLGYVEEARRLLHEKTS